jgi:hypothetical protein
MNREPRQIRENKGSKPDLHNINPFARRVNLPVVCILFYVRVFWVFRGFICGPLGLSRIGEDNPDFEPLICADTR